MLSEIRVAKSRTLASLCYVLNSKSDEVVGKYNQFQANQMVTLD